MEHLIDKLPAESYVAPRTASHVYIWVVFALSFGLLLSDYMSRQVLNAVFPLLKETWHLSDTRLGSLSGIVALMVAILTFPLSVLADRWGRVRSVVLMGALWSLATLGCALSNNYDEMLLARAFVGVGEAAYGSVGLAIVLSIFPPSLRATLTGAFMAGGAFGSVLGMALGGIVAVHLGWRWSFGAMAAFGIALVVVYAVTVTERRVAHQRWHAAGDASPATRVPMRFRTLLKGLFSTVSVNCAYVGSALQLFIMGAVLAWMPSFLNRYYGLPTDKAGVGAAAFLLAGGMGMILCGGITDRVSRTHPTRKWLTAIVYSGLSFILLGAGFHLTPGTPQLIALGAGIFFVAGTAGPAGAMVTRLTPPAIHASTLATFTLANNLLGLAPGPLVAGVLADHMGLIGALQVIPLAALVATGIFVVGCRHYRDDLKRLDALQAAASR